MDYIKLNTQHERNEFFQFLEENAPGTATDTVYGRLLQESLVPLSGRKLCDLGPAQPAFVACSLLTYDWQWAQRLQHLALRTQHGTLAFQGRASVPKNGRLPFLLKASS